MSPRGRSRRYSILRKLRRLRYVRFESLADICAAQGHVRFTPISTAKADMPQKSCLLYPQKRTYAAQQGMSAKGQKQTLRLYSITSSARVSTDEGIVRPIAFAVLRLTTNSYLVGVCTGRSAGLSPLRMRST